MSASQQGYPFTYNDARAYDAWLDRPVIRERTRREHALMFRMLEPLKGQSILDIGCGTGDAMAVMLERGLAVSGLDASPYMLDVAERKLRASVDLHRSAAESLPFDDNHFTYATLLYTLEFTDDPRRALAEAFRVAKDRVFIGILNRHSARAMGLRAVRRFTRNVYRHARFLSVWEVSAMVRDLMGNVPVSWNAITYLPNPLRWLPRQNRLLNVTFKSPVAPFIGISVVLMPRYKVTPLPLKCRTKSLKTTLTCLARNFPEAA